MAHIPSPQSMMRLMDKSGKAYTITFAIKQHGWYKDCEVYSHSGDWLWIKEKGASAIEPLAVSWDQITCIRIHEH